MSSPIDKIIADARASQPDVIGNIIKHPSKPATHAPEHTQPHVSVASPNVNAAIDSWAKEHGSAVKTVKAEAPAAHLATTQPLSTGASLSDAQYQQAIADSTRVAAEANSLLSRDEGHGLTGIKAHSTKVTLNR